MILQDLEQNAGYMEYNLSVNFGGGGDTHPAGLYADINACIISIHVHVHVLCTHACKVIDGNKHGTYDVCGQVQVIAVATPF